MITFQDYIKELKKGRFKKRVKIEWLRQEDESTYEDMTADIISGNLSVNRQNGIRRSVNLQLKNINGKYIPNEDGIWINQKFKLYLGLEINGEDYFIPNGVFVLDDPEVTSNFSESYINITGKDKFSALDGSLGGQLDSIYQIPVGTNIHSVIKSILTLANDKNQPILLSDFANEITPYTIKKEYGNNNYGQILIELAQMLSANIYYNELGQLVFEKDVEDSLKGSIWDFNTDEFHYLGATNKYVFSKVYNKIVVIGSNINGNIATGIAINNNLQSNTRVQLIGLKTKEPIMDDMITTDDLAQQRANYELKRAIGVQSAVSIKSTAFFHFDVDQVITLTDSNLKLIQERFLIQSINLDFKNEGTMTISCVKSKELDI